MNSADLLSKNISAEKKIIITTVHKAKGLEFDSVVYLPKRTRTHKNFQDLIVRKILETKGIDAEEMMPYLKEIYKRPEKESNVTLYYDYKGVKSVFQDIIRTDETNRVMDSEGQFTEKMPYYSPHFIEGLNENNIKVKHLVRGGGCGTE